MCRMKKSGGSYFQNIKVGDNMIAKMYKISVGIVAMIFFINIFGIITNTTVNAEGNSIEETWESGGIDLNKWNIHTYCDDTPSISSIYHYSDSYSLYMSDHTGGTSPNIANKDSFNMEKISIQFKIFIDQLNEHGSFRFQFFDDVTPSGTGATFDIGEIHIGTDSLNLNFRKGTSSNSEQYTGFNLNENTWYTFLVNLDQTSNTIEIIVDNNKVYSGETVGDVINYVMFSASSRHDSGIDYYIDDIQVNTLQSTQDNDLISYWSFDDSSNLGYDSSGNGHQGNIFGASSSDGVCNGAIHFDGTDDYMTVSDYNDFEFDQNDDFTFNFWRKDYDNGGSYYIGCSIDHNAGQYSGWGIHSATYPNTDSTKGNGIGVYVTESSSSVSTVSSSLDDDWHMITFIKSGDQMKLYFDGVLKDTNTINTPVYVDHGFIIGANINDGYKDPEYFFNGLLDEIRVYNYALSSNEINNLYEECDSNNDIGEEIIIEETWESGGIDLNKWNIHTYCDDTPSISSIYHYSDSYSLYMSDHTGGTSPNIANKDSFNMEKISIQFKIFIDQLNEHGSFRFQFFDDVTPSGTGATFDIGEIHIGTDSLNLNFRKGTSSNSEQYTGFNLNENTWYTFLVNLDQTSNTIEIIVDNNKVYSGETVGDVINYVMFSASSRHDSGIDYYIDDIQVNTLQSTQDNDLISYWSFDDSSNLGYDSSGNGHQGNIFGASSSDGVCNGAIHFDGTDDYMTVSDYNDFEFDQNDDFTFNFWRKDYDNGGSYYIGCSIDHNAGQYSGWGIHSATYPNTDSTKGNGIGVYVTESSSSVSTVSSSLDDDWHMITFIKSGDQMKLYFDGVLKDTNTINTPVYVDHGFIIGANINDGYKDPEYFFNGLLDEIRVYNYALSSNEIKDLYESCISISNNKPDFSVENTDISFTDQNPSVGDDIAIYAMISNNGDKEGSVMVKFYDGNPSSNLYPSSLIESTVIELSSGESELVSVDWSVVEEGSHDMYVVISDIDAVETDVSDNEAYTSLFVGEGGDSLLVVTVDNTGISKFDPGSTRTLTAKVYCYNNSVENVNLKILDNDNLSVIVKTPSCDMYAEEQRDFLLTIEVPELSNDTKYKSNNLVIQAVGDNGIVSNAEPVEIIISDTDDVPGFTAVAIVAATSLGALVAFFRRRHRNREI